MMDGEECMGEDAPAFIRDEHIVTSVAWRFREWAMEIADMLGIEQYRGTFGLPRKK